MKINNEGLDIIKEFEGFREEAYLDTGGVWTIGYGTTASAGLGIIPKKGMHITKEEAEQYLREYIVKVEAQVMAKVNVPLTQNQFSALVSFVYNIGPTQFGQSTLLRLLNQKDYKGAASQFDRWVYDNGKLLAGLERRRKAEKALFLKEVPVNQEKGLLGLLTQLIGAIFGRNK